MPASIDGDDITGLTIDGDEVAEVTMDGNVVWSSGPYGFEDQNTNGWDVTKSHSITSSTALNSSYSYDNDASVGGYFLANTSLSGEKPDQIEFGYRETSSSGGLAYLPKDTNGDLILAAGTGNPQLNVEHGNGTWYPGDGDYNTWQWYIITFDWSNQTFDIEWDSKNSGNYHSNSNLEFMNKNGGGISEIGVGYHNFTDWAVGNPKGHEWVDNIWGGIK